MSNVDNSKKNLPVDPNQGAGAFMIVVGALVGLALAGASASSVFAASTFAGWAVVVVVAAIVVLAVLVWLKDERITLPFVLLVLSALWAAFAGAIVFDNHWLAFTPAAWVLNALFLAALVAGAWNKLQAWAKALAALTAASLVVATVVLPRPPGGEGPLDTAEKWKIDIEVADEADNAPLDGARALCGTVMQWENALQLADTTARTSGRDGRVETWEFDEDPRLKIVICTVWKDANEGNAGYPAESQIVLAPAGGGEYRLKFALNENPHPDTAFLALDLSGSFENQNWYYLDFEVWLGEPQGYVNANEGPQPLLRKKWSELRGAGFTLPAADTQNALTLRYRYEGPAGPDLGPPYSETVSVPIGPIAAGTRRRVALTIPAQQTVN